MSYSSNICVPDAFVFAASTDGVAFSSCDVRVSSSALEISSALSSASSCGQNTPMKSTSPNASSMTNEPAAMDDCNISTMCVSEGPPSAPSFRSLTRMVIVDADSSELTMRTRSSLIPSSSAISLQKKSCVGRLWNLATRMDVMSSTSTVFTRDFERTGARLLARRILTSSSSDGASVGGGGEMSIFSIVVVDADENAMTVFAAVRQDMRVRSSSPPSSPRMVTKPPSDDDTTR